MTTLFFSYAHADEGLRDRLERHLAMLRRQGVIDVWHDRRIVLGEDFGAAIAAELEKADLILLLISPDFSPPIIVMNRRWRGRWSATQPARPRCCR
jgi:TIR domain